MRTGLIFFFIFSSVLFAQEKPIALKHFVKQEKILIRWAVGDPDLFVLGLKNGYVLEKTMGEQKQTIVIPPFSERVSEFKASADSIHLGYLELINSLITEASLSPELKKMTVTILLLGSSADIKLANYCGLFYSDLNDGRHVSYSVSIPKTDFQSNPILCKGDELSENAVMTTLSARSQAKRKQVYLSWEAKTLQKNYGAYWIEKSADSITFTNVNTYPYHFLKSADEPNKTNCDYADTSVTEGDTWYYRITGINYFGENGKSTQIVKVYVPHSVYGEVHIDSVTVQDKERTLHAQFVSEKTQNKIEKFVLFRSDSLAENYAVVSEIPFTSKPFQMTSAVSVTSGDRYYYKIAAIGFDADTLYSFPYYFFTLDQIPPMTPIGLNGTVNDVGIVNLQWTLNPENDIRGYRIYRSNSLLEEFVEITNEFARDGTFSDTINLRNLTPEIYYRISAVDLNYNNSKLSAPVLILKPDTIAPVQAIINDYLVTANGLEIKWINSSSKDIQKSYLIRSKNNQTDTVFYWTDLITNFTDTSCENGSAYSYSILVKDKSNNYSVSPAIQINYETGVRTGVTDIQAVADREKKQVRLSWKLPDEPIYSIQIYRAVNEGEFALYKTLRGPDFASFIDTNVSINNTYHYKIKLVLKSGISSRFSKTKEIIY